MRSALAMADCMIVNLADRSRMGTKNFFTYSMKATSTPNDWVPSTMSGAAIHSRPATVTVPRASTAAHRIESQRIDSKLASRCVRLISSNSAIDRR